MQNHVGFVELNDDSFQDPHDENQALYHFDNEGKSMDSPLIFPLDLSFAEIFGETRDDQNSGIVFLRTLDDRTIYDEIPHSMKMVRRSTIF